MVSYVGCVPMADVLPFLVVGIASGSIYGLAAMGLVLSYKTSGIFNFAHGAIAALAAYAFYDLHVLRGLPWPMALAIAVIVLPPVLAVVLERLTRALAGGGVTTQVVATVGLQLAITSALIAHYGGAAIAFPKFLPAGTFEVLGIFVGVDQLISAMIAAVAAAVFFGFFKFSPMGVRMRAVVDNPDLLGLAGISPFAVRSWAWLIGTWFAAMSGVLLAPQIGLDAFLLTLLVVQAYGAAAVGLFSSLPLTYAGGLLVGVLSALATKFVSGSQVLSGLPPAIPFLVLFAVLLLVPRRKLVEAGERRTAVVAPPLVSRSTARVLSLVAVAVAVAVPMVVDVQLPVYANALVFVIFFYSLDLLVRTSGQVSLAHAALVAVGAAAFSHLAVDSGLPWLVAVLLAGLVAVPVGAIVAIPAIRLSGLFLALATYGFALLLENVAYLSEWMFGGTNSRPAPRPDGLEGDTAFYYVLLAFAVAAAVLVTVVRHSRLGRLLRGMANSPTTLSTLGLGVNVTRVTVFSISAFIAGIGGALYAAQGYSATGAPFTSFAALMWLAVLVMNSGLRSAAPIAAAIALTIPGAYITNETVLEWLPVVFGVFAVLVAIHEASQRLGVGGNQSEEPTGPEPPAGSELSAGSRLAERKGAPGPVVDRLREAAVAATRRPNPPAVRVGARVSLSRERR